MPDSKITISLLTNIIPPYRVPIFENIAKHERVEEFRVLTCTDMEADRKWDVVEGSLFEVKKLKGLTINIPHITNRETFRIIHLKFSILFELLINKPDVLIIGDGSWTSYIAAICCKLYNIPYIIWSEITSKVRVDKSLINKIRKYVFKTCNRCIAAGKLSEEYLQSLEVDESKISIVNNAIDNSYFKKLYKKNRSRKKEIRKKLDIGDEEFVFIFVGKLIERKRIIETIRSCHKASKIINLHLLVVGTGPLEDDLKVMTKRLNFDDVSFLGYLSPSELAEHYIASDSLILLSDDVWGMVVNEALVFDIPFFCCSEVGAAVDLLEKNSKSIVIEYKSEEQVSKKIIDFVNNYDRKFVGTVPTVEEMATGIVDTVLKVR